MLRQKEQRKGNFCQSILILQAKCLNYKDKKGEFLFHLIILKKSEARILLVRYLRSKIIL